MAELVSMSWALFHLSRASLSYVGYLQQVDSIIGHTFWLRSLRENSLATSLVHN